MAQTANATQADLARLDAILKDRAIQDAIRTAMNKATPFAEQITQQLTLSGRKGIFPVQFGVNEGIYARADKEQFGDSQVDQPELAEVKAKFIYALFEISGPIMSASRDDPGAFNDALALTLDNTVDGLKLDMGRQVIGDGSGVIGLVADSTNETDEIDVKSPFGLDRYKQSRPVRGILRRNMPLDVLDEATPTTKHGDNLPVASVTHTNSVTELTFSASDGDLTNAAEDDLLVRHNNHDLEIEGWLAAVDDAGSYLNITRTGNEGWQGILVDAAGGGTDPVPLDPDHLRDTVDTVMEVSGQEPNLLVCNYKQRRNIYNLYSAQIRYAPMVLPAGLRENTLAFDDMGVLVERFFPPEHIGIANTAFWFHAIDKDVEWIRGLNGTVLHFTLDSDVFRAVMRTYRNMVCLYPATNAMIYGLAE